MNGIEIEHYVGLIPETKRYFKGVYSSNNMPISETLYCFIVNTDPSDQPGDHWLAFWVNEKSVEFFDTYGRTSWNQMFSSSFSKFIDGRTCVYNTVVLEGIFSKTCGQFSIYYTCLRCLGVTYDDILNSFSVNVIVNDKLVTNFLSWI